MLGPANVNYRFTAAIFALVILSGAPCASSDITENLVGISEKAGHKNVTKAPHDDIFMELFTNATHKAIQLTSEKIQMYEDFLRGKRGALDLAAIIKCATNCDPLIFQGYGCFCGFLGSGEPVDGIDTCCKMHDWCYTTSSCMNLEWHLPYLVPFKWKCNGGAPYCIPGKTKKTDRDSCSHQLCECDREFSMCLQKYLPCPTAKPECKSKSRPRHNSHHHDHNQASERLEDIHGPPHHFKPPPLFEIPNPIIPRRGFNIRFHG